MGFIDQTDGTFDVRSNPSHELSTICLAKKRIARRHWFCEVEVVSRSGGDTQFLQAARCSLQVGGEPTVPDWDA